MNTKNECCEKCLPNPNIGFTRENGSRYCGVACPCHESAKPQCTCPTKYYEAKTELCPVHNYIPPTDTAEKKCNSSPFCSHNTNGRDLDKPCSVSIPTTDTSDWRERFREQFVAPPPFEETLYSIKPEFIEVFIENELERQQKKDSTAIRDGEYLTPREVELFERGVKKGYEKGRAEGIAYEDRAFSVGKSEALSLVRKMIEETTTLYKKAGYGLNDEILRHLLTNLSTLEGK